MRFTAGSLPARAVGADREPPLLFPHAQAARYQVDAAEQQDHQHSVMKERARCPALQPQPEVHPDRHREVGELPARKIAEST